MVSGRLGGVVAALALAAAAIGGCAPDPPAPAPTTTTPGPAPAPSPSAPDRPAPATEDPMEADFGAATGAPAPVWDDAATAAALATATAVMTAYARPALDPAQWWEEFSAHLSPAARHDYQWVQPASIPATAVVSEQAAVVDTSSVYLARVDVPTDVGTYQVLLSRQDGPTPWVVERIDPAEGAG